MIQCDDVQDTQMLALVFVDTLYLNLEKRLWIDDIAGIAAQIGRKILLD